MKIPESLLLTITNEISYVTIPVAHFRDFNVITNEDISFQVLRVDDWFKAVPQVSFSERKATGMPEELFFVYANHVVVAANNMEEETMNVIKNIILELEVPDII